MFPVCDGKCDGLSLHVKCLINDECDGVTAQNPKGYQLNKADSSAAIKLEGGLGFHVGEFA